MAGTYKILPFSADCSGLLSYTDQHGVYHYTAPDSATILNIVKGTWLSGLLYNYIQGVGGSTVSGSVSCLPDFTKISLDGGSFINEIQLPIGFNLTSARYTPVISAPLTTNTSTSVYATISHTPAAIVDLSIITLGYVLTSFFGVTWGINDLNNGAMQVGSQLITGNYDIISTSWQLENLTFPNTNVPLIIRPGDIVKISTPDNSYDFTTIDKVNFNPTTFVFSTSFITWTPLSITLQVPYLNAYSPASPSGVITIEGTQFSGSAVLAPVLTLLADSSGIYSIVPNKISDTLYVGAGSSLTADNKIPNPFIKTGFIGG